MVLGDMIVGHNGDVRALQKRLDELAGARQQTGSDFDVITACVKRDPKNFRVWADVCLVYQGKVVITIELSPCKVRAVMQCLIVCLFD